MNYYKEMLDESRVPLYSEGKHIFSEIIIDNEAAYYSTASIIESDNVVEISKEEFEEVLPKTSIKTISSYQPTNAEVAQMISDLQADLIIAGVI